MKITTRDRRYNNVFMDVLSGPCLTPVRLQKLREGRRTLLRRHRGRTDATSNPLLLIFSCEKGSLLCLAPASSAREMQSFTKATTYLTWAHTGSVLLPSTRRIPEGSPSRKDMPRSCIFGFCRRAVFLLPPKEQKALCVPRREQCVRLAVCSFAALIRPKLFY
jgi:hypothetical protein